MEAEKEESEDEEMEDDGADASRRAATFVVWILMVVNSQDLNPPQFTPQKSNIDNRYKNNAFFFKGVTFSKAHHFGAPQPR